jgi:Fur family transcriptional regulator, ferric uptake regulator
VNKKNDAAIVDKAREILRGAGLRSTPARIAVLIALQRGSKPQTHAELADRLVPMGFDKATVFRNLTDLTDAELVSRTELGDHVWRFEIRDPSHDRSSHPHFVCVDCGTVSCMDGIELPDDSQKKTLNIARISEILVKGHCLACEPA